MYQRKVCSQQNCQVCLKFTIFNFCNWLLLKWYIIHEAGQICSNFLLQFKHNQSNYWPVCAKLWMIHLSLKAEFYHKIAQLQLARVFLSVLQGCLIIPGILSNQCRAANKLHFTVFNCGRGLKMSWTSKLEKLPPTMKMPVWNIISLMTLSLYKQLQVQFKH